MGWASIDDGFFNHPKVMNLLLTPGVDGLRAVGLWALALSWAYKYTIDKPQPEQGIIPASQVNAWDRLLGGAVDAAEALADAELWDRLPGGLYQIHDFRQWSHLEIREAKQRGGKVGAARRWQPQDALFDDSAISNGNGTPKDARNGTPITEARMESITSASASASASASESEREFAQFWAVYPKREAKIAARRIWDRLMAKGIDPQAIVDGAVRYAEHREQSIAIDRNDSRKFTAHPATWLNQGRWLDELITPESRPSVIEIAPWDQ